MKIMPIRLADSAIEELERLREPQQADWWTWPKMYPSETNGSGMLTSFEEGLRDWIVQPGYENVYVYVISAEDMPLQITVGKSVEWATGAQPEQEKFITGYYVFPVTQPVGAVSISQKVAIIGNFTIGGQVPSFSVTPRFFFGRPGGLVPAWEQRLRDLTQLLEGWDSYGSPYISDEAIDRTKSLLEEVSTKAGIQLASEAFIAPCPDGGLQVNWDLGQGKELVVDIPPTEEPIAYLLTETMPSGEQSETEGHIRGTADLNNLFSRVS